MRSSYNDGRGGVGGEVCVPVEVRPLCRSHKCFHFKLAKQ